MLDVELVLDVELELEVVGSVATPHAANPKKMHRYSVEYKQHFFRLATVKLLLVIVLFKCNQLEEVEQINPWLDENCRAVWLNSEKGKSEPVMIILSGARMATPDLLTDDWGCSLSAHSPRHWPSAPPAVE